MRQEFADFGALEPIRQSQAIPEYLTQYIVPHISISLYLTSCGSQENYLKLISFHS